MYLYAYGAKCDAVMRKKWWKTKKHFSEEKKNKGDDDDDDEDDGVTNAFKLCEMAYNLHSLDNTNRNIQNIKSLCGCSLTLCMEFNREMLSCCSTETLGCY